MQPTSGYWIIKLLYDWQTIIAGLFALAGGLWTVKKIRDQIKQTQDISNDARRHEEFAARSVLPLALSELTNYSLRCIRLIQLNSAGPVIAGQELPAFEKDVVGVLQECARYAQEGIAAKIWILLSKLQVQQARLRDLLVSKSGEELTQNDTIQNSLDAADIYAKTAELYDYARHEQGMRQRAPSDKLLSAFHACGYWVADEHLAIHYLEQQDAEGEAEKGCGDFDDYQHLQSTVDQG